MHGLCQLSLAAAYHCAVCGHQCNGMLDGHVQKLHADVQLMLHF